MTTQNSKISWTTAGALVVANMVGTGVFTSLGYQVVDITNTWSLLMLWLLGGLISLSGAFSYAEIGSVFTRSGGEYNYLTKLYNPMIGYLAGWVSLTVGFSAPVALTSMALGGYMGSITGWSETIIALTAVIGIGFVHSFSIKSSSLFQNTTTVLKVVVMVLIIFLGLFMESDVSGFDFSNSWRSEVTMPFYAVALVYVTYAYSGWNAASYIVEEIKTAQSNLPKALIRGTALVTILYVALHYVFLKHATIDQLVNKLDVGHVFATNLLGTNGGIVISSLIGFFLISSISAMIWVGPRVSKVMGEDYPLWSFLKNTNSKGIPLNAIWFQISLSILMIFTGTFQQILVYCGFLLQISSAMCVLGSFIIRRIPHLSLNYKSPFHPIFPLLFLGISLWILVFLISEKPVESLIGLSTLLLGLLTFYISKKKFK